MSLRDEAIKAMVGDGDFLDEVAAARALDRLLEWLREAQVAVGAAFHGQDTEPVFLQELTVTELADLLSEGEDG